MVGFTDTGKIPLLWDGILSYLVRWWKHDSGLGEKTLYHFEVIFHIMQHDLLTPDWFSVAMPELASSPVLWCCVVLCVKGCLVGNYRYWWNHLLMFSCSDWLLHGGIEMGDWWNQILLFYCCERHELSVALFCICNLYPWMCTVSVIFWATQLEGVSMLK